MSLTYSLPRRNSFELVMLAWRSSLTAISRMPYLFVSAFLLRVGVGFVGTNFVANSTSFSTRTIISIVSLATAALILAPVAVAVHRLILLEQTTGGIISLRPAHTLQYFIWVFLFGLCSLLGNLLLGDLVPLLPANIPTVARLTIALVVSLPLIYPGVRLCLIFPAVAIDDWAASWRDRLGVGWGRSRGQFWLIFLAGFLALLPLRLLFASVMPILFYFHLVPLGAAARLYISVVVTLTTGLTAVGMTIVGAAIASWVYRSLVEDRQPYA